MYFRESLKLEISCRYVKIANFICKELCVFQVVILKIKDIFIVETLNLLINVKIA